MTNPATLCSSRLSYFIYIFNIARPSLPRFRAPFNRSMNNDKLTQIPIYIAVDLEINVKQWLLHWSGEETEDREFRIYIEIPDHVDGTNDGETQKDAESHSQTPQRGSSSAIVLPRPPNSQLYVEALSLSYHARPLAHAIVRSSTRLLINSELPSLPLFEAQNDVI